MEIDLAELKAIFMREIEHLEELGYEHLNIPVDYYWNIPHEIRYDPYQEPKQLDLGQLSEDWEWLKQTLDGKRDPLAYDLVWLSTILRAVGEHTRG